MPRSRCLTRWVAMGAPGPARRARPRRRPVGRDRHQTGPRVLGVPTSGDPPDPRRPDATWPRTRARPVHPRRARGQGLATPAPAADRRTLIRRATFDLIGLPPTPEEVDAFLADDARKRSPGSSIGCSPRPTTANAGAGTGSTSPAMPTPTAWTRTSPTATPGATATTSSPPSTATSPTTSSCSNSSRATCSRRRRRVRSPAERTADRDRVPRAGPEGARRARRARRWRWTSSTSRSIPWAAPSWADPRLRPLPRP